MTEQNKANQSLEDAVGTEKPTTASKVADLGKTVRQREKEEQKAKEYWNTMISRREAYEMVQETYANLAQQFQLLMVQNTTLLEILAEKGVATAEEINEHSKKVIESMYGPMPEAMPTEEPTDETPLAD